MGSIRNLVALLCEMGVMPCCVRASGGHQMAWGQLITKDLASEVDNI